MDHDHGQIPPTSSRLGPCRSDRRPATGLLLRQLRDWKGSIEIEQLLPRGLAMYAEVCGWTLARAHARSGDRVAIASHLGKSHAFDRAFADFAVAYADQNERDYDALKNGIESGRITSIDGCGV
jgi:hypothetical protein